MGRAAYEPSPPTIALVVIAQETVTYLQTIKSAHCGILCWGGKLKIAYVSIRDRRGGLINASVFMEYLEEIQSSRKASKTDGETNPQTSEPPRTYTVALEHITE